MSSLATIPLSGYRSGIAAKNESANTAAFVLFLLTNAALFLRPGEIIASVEALPIYQVLNLLCVAACLPQLIRKVGRARFNTSPITSCVLGLGIAVVFSHLSRFDVGSALTSFLEFTKLAIYYLLINKDTRTWTPTV